MGEATTSDRAQLADDDLAELVVALGREPTREEAAVVAVLWSEAVAGRTARWVLASLVASAEECGAARRGAALAAPLDEGRCAVLRVVVGDPAAPTPGARAAAAVGAAVVRTLGADANPIAVLDAIRLGGRHGGESRADLARTIEGLSRAATHAGLPVLGSALSLDAGCAGGEAVAVFAVGWIGEEPGAARPEPSDGDPLWLVGATAGGPAGGSGGAPEGAGGVDRWLLEAVEELRGARLLAASEPVAGGGLAAAAVALAQRLACGIELDAGALGQESGAAEPLAAILAAGAGDRLLVAVPRELEGQASAICAGLGVPRAAVGRVVAAPRLRLAISGGNIDLPIHLLANPTLRPRRSAEPAAASQAAELRLAELPEPRDYGAALRQVVMAPNLASRRFLHEQMDSYCGGATSLHPGADAAALRVPGAPLQLGLTVDSRARFAALDPYVGACISVCESARNLVAIGAKPIAGAVWLDAGPIDRHEVIWQVQQSVSGLRDAAVAFGVPLLDSGIRFAPGQGDELLAPAPTVAMIGALQGPVALTPWFKSPGDVIFLLGRTRDELAGAEFVAVVHGVTGGTPPWVDLEAETLLHRVVLAAAERSLLSSVHDIAGGGIAMAVVEGCCAAPDGIPARGARIRPDETMRPDAWLFGESQARMLVTCRREGAALLRELASDAGVAIALIGEVGGTMLDIEGLITISVAELRALWTGALGRWVEGG